MTERDATAMLLALVALIVLPLLAFTYWLWRMGAKAIAEERFPPSGVRVVGRVIELSGDTAKRRGRLAQVFAAGFLMLAAAIIIMTWRLLQWVGQY
jgi:hypothetical protein